MSLKIIEARLIGDFFSSVASASATPPTTGGADEGAEVAGTQTGNFSNAKGFMYHIARDFLATCARITSTGININGGMFAVDPTLSNAADPQSKYFQVAVDVYFYMLPGQFNPVTGQQRLYSSSGISVGPEEINIDTLALSGGPEWTGINGDFILNTGFTLGGVGGWGHDNAISGTLIFEGLTDGVPGETIQTGASVYPSGLALLGNGDFSGTVAGKANKFNFVWVDLDTRLAEGILGGDVIDNPLDPPQAFPLEVDGTPSNDASEAPIAGDEFHWSVVQYIPDSDATFGRPKGLLMFQSKEEIPTITVSVPGDAMRHYIRLADFNPFGDPSASGVPTRTHGRIRLTSRALQGVNPMGNVAGADAIGNPSAPAQMQFDPLRQRFIALLASQDLSPFPGDLGANDGSVMISYALTADPVVFSAPTARDVPRTNDVISFETFVGGDIQEPVGGITVAWTLTRRSTEGEIIDASTFPGTSQLDNPPVDEDQAGDPILLITADATPLVLTTDYTVNTTTGLITWVTDQSGAALVLATYEHRGTGATPAHGALLTSTSTTNEFGNARTQVSYPDDDDLVGKLDALASEEG